MDVAVPILLVVDCRPGIAEARASALQDEAGTSLDVRHADTVGEALDVCRRVPTAVAAVVASHALAPGMSGLDLLARMRREFPHVRRILVTTGDISAASREPEYVRLHAAFDGSGRFVDVASRIVQDALDGVLARPEAAPTGSTLA